MRGDGDLRSILQRWGAEEAIEHEARPFLEDDCLDYTNNLTILEDIHIAHIVVLLGMDHSNIGQVSTARRERLRESHGFPGWRDIKVFIVFKVRTSIEDKTGQ